MDSVGGFSGPFVFVGPLGGAASPLPSRTLLGCDIDMFRILEELSQPGGSLHLPACSRGAHRCQPPLLQCVPLRELSLMAFPFCIWRLASSRRI